MKSIKSAARIHGRKSGLLLLSLFILTAWGDGVAHADGVTGTIKNTETVTGTVTGKGFDTYTFKVTAGSSFFANVSETGTHDETLYTQYHPLGSRQRYRAFSRAAAIHNSQAE